MKKCFYLLYLIACFFVILLSSCFFVVENRDFTITVVNDIGDNYEIEWVIFQPSGFSTVQMTGTYPNNYPTYGYIPWNDTLRWREWESFIIREGTYDLYVYASAWDGRQYTNYLFVGEQNKNCIGGSSYTWSVRPGDINYSIKSPNILLKSRK